jgi:hypothetical protein
MNKFKELMEAIDILITKKMKNTTQVYFGIIKSIDNNNCIIAIKGNNYNLKYYGNVPVVNKKYPVIVPQGNFSQAFIIG